jgi:hypothetical protein
MITVESGVKYKLEKTDGSTIDLNFCHKENGIFQHGITNEEVVKLLRDRFEQLLLKEDSTENHRCLIHIMQIQMHLRSRSDYKLKKHGSNGDRGNGIPVQDGVGKAGQ